MKRIISVFLAAMMLFSLSITTNAATKVQVNKYLTDTASYLMSHNTNPTMGSVGGEWLIMGLARAEKIRDSYGITYRNNLVTKVKDCRGRLSERKYTEYARVVIALTAIKEDPKNFQGYNLLKPLAELDCVKRQGANGIIFTLIALDCGNYDIPKPDVNYDGEITTREKLIQLILNAELEDGGWSYTGKEAEADMTAMTIQALAPYYKKNDEVRKAINKGIEALSNLQLSDGSYETGKLKTCEGTAQVLTALSEMDISINDKRFVKNGKTVLDGLLQYYKNGGFMHTVGGSINEMATEQAFCAMTSYYRSISGRNKLYQMSDAKKLSESKEKETKKDSKKKVAGKKENTKKETATKASQEAKKERSTEITRGKTNENVEAGKRGHRKGSEKETSTALKEKEKKQKETVLVTRDESKTRETESLQQETTTEMKSDKEEESPKKDSFMLYVGIFSGAVVLLGGIFFWRKKH